MSITAKKIQTRFQGYSVLTVQRTIKRMKDLNFHVKTKHVDRFPNWKKDYVPPTTEPQV